MPYPVTCENEPMKFNYRRILSVAFLAVAFVMALGLTVVSTGQEIPAQSAALIDDWTHHHLVFSNPGTFADALKNGTLARWYKITNDPRYQIQQLKHSLLQRQLAAAPDFAALMAPMNAATTDAVIDNATPASTYAEAASI